MADFNSQEDGGSDNLHLLLKARGVQGSSRLSPGTGAVMQSPHLSLSPTAFFLKHSSLLRLSHLQRIDLWPLSVQHLMMFGAFILAAPNRDAVQLSLCCRWWRGAGVTLCGRPIRSP